MGHHWNASNASAVATQLRRRSSFLCDAILMLPKQLPFRDAPKRASKTEIGSRPGLGIPTCKKTCADVQVCILKYFVRPRVHVWQTRYFKRPSSDHYRSGTTTYPHPLGGVCGNWRDPKDFCKACFGMWQTIENNPDSGTDESRYVAAADGASTRSPGRDCQHLPLLKGNGRAWRPFAGGKILFVPLFSE